jgi:hypothetical protein
MILSCAGNIIAGGDSARHRLEPDQRPVQSRCRILGGYRDPKMALPTRTQVAPQPIAISKSADMPIDTVANP